MGRYEWDLPRWGIWFGDGWVYEGDLAEAVEKEITTTTTSISSSVMSTSKDNATMVTSKQDNFMRANITKAKNAPSVFACSFF